MSNTRSLSTRRDVYQQYIEKNPPGEFQYDFNRRGQSGKVNISEYQLKRAAKLLTNPRSERESPYKEMDIQNYLSSKVGDETPSRRIGKLNRTKNLAKSRSIPTFQGIIFSKFQRSIPAAVPSAYSNSLVEHARQQNRLLVSSLSSNVSPRIKAKNHIHRKSAAKVESLGRFKTSRYSLFGEKSVFQENPYFQASTCRT